MDLAFITDVWEGMSPEKSSTLRMIHEAMDRGHRVAIISPPNLTVRANVVYGFFKSIEYNGKLPENIITMHKKADFTTELLPLHSFDAIIIRKDPPLDNIMLNFLDSVKNETVIINDADGIRRASNKLYTTTFHDIDDGFIPQTHVSKNAQYLRRVIEESEKEKMILKPLNQSGGSGVIVVEKKARHSLNSLLDFYIGEGENKQYVMLQEFVEGVEYGDVRVLVLGGKAIGAYRRVPAEGDIRANIQAGGRPEKHEMTDREKSIIRKIGPKILEDGIHFAGVDLIGEKLIEVNVLNPGGISNINKLYRKKLQKDFIDYVEELVTLRGEKLYEQVQRLQRRQEYKSQRNTSV